MVKLKRFFYILLLNAMVSATATVAVLVLWENRQNSKANTTQDVVYIHVTQIVTATVFAPEPILATLTPSPIPTSEVSEDFPVPVAEYRVQKGDTLTEIARTFDVSLTDLMTINQIEDPDTIEVDQVLYIPILPLPTNTPAVPTTSVPSLTFTVVKTATATKTPTQIGDQPSAIIESVQGVGILDLERVIIVREGPGILSLSGFRLKDTDGNEFIFPQLDLLEGGKITVHTTNGQNTVTDLYWGLNKAIWTRGEKVTLEDSEGKIHATLTIP